MPDGWYEYAAIMVWIETTRLQLAAAFELVDGIAILVAPASTSNT